MPLLGRQHKTSPAALLVISLRFGLVEGLAASGDLFDERDCPQFTWLLACEDSSSLEGCSSSKAFPPEFRRDVVAVARKGEAPVAQVARRTLGSPSRVCTAGAAWPISIKVCGRASRRRSPRSCGRAKNRIRLLEQEAEVMRRAVTYLSRDVNRLPCYGR